MECTMHFQKGDVVRAMCKLTKEIPKTEFINQRNFSVVGTISHLKTSYLSTGTVVSTKKREAGMGNGKSRGEVVTVQGFTL